MEYHSYYLREGKMGSEKWERDKDRDKSSESVIFFFGWMKERKNKVHLTQHLTQQGWLKWNFTLESGKCKQLSF
jgi:hypothetical protein